MKLWMPRDGRPRILWRFKFKQKPVFYWKTSFPLFHHKLEGVIWPDLLVNALSKAGDRYEKKEHNARPQREQLPIKYKGQGTHHLLSSNLILRGQQLLLPEYWAAPNIRKTSFYEPSTSGPIAYCQLLYRSDAGFRPIIGYTSTISIAYPFWLVNTSRFWSMIISIESEM